MLLRHTFLLQHAGILEALPVRVVFTSSHSSTRAVGMFPSRDVTTSWRIFLSLVPSHLDASSHTCPYTDIYIQVLCISRRRFLSLNRTSLRDPPHGCPVSWRRHVATLRIEVEVEGRTRRRRWWWWWQHAMAGKRKGGGTK